MISSSCEISCKNLLQYNVEEHKEFLNSFDLILSDCDGVIWMSSGAIPQAGEAIQMLRANDKAVKFVSNNSMRTDEQYVTKLASIGIPHMQEDDVIHPGKTILWYLQNHMPNSKVFSLLTIQSNDLLRKNGIDVVTLDLELEKLDGGGLMEMLLDCGPTAVDAVLIDVAPHVSYSHVLKAMQYLKDDKCLLICGAMDAVIPLTPNLKIPGFTELYDFIEKQTQKQRIVLGKPSPQLGDIIKEKLQISDPKRCLFIGDSLRQDIRFGKSCGFRTLFVLSGIDGFDDMLNAPETCQPDYYTNSIKDFLEIYERIK